MHLAINFIHFLYGTGRQKQTKVRSFCFKCYFWASSCKPLLHTLFLVTHRGPDRQREPTGTTGGSKLKRLARCGRQRSRIKRLGHGAVSGHRWLAGCADGCLLEFMKSFMVLLDPLSLSVSKFSSSANHVLHFADFLLLLKTLLVKSRKTISHSLKAEIQSKVYTLQLH